MNIDNRRLREIQREKLFYQDRLEKTNDDKDSLIYKGKLECLEKEEKDILKRYDAI